MASSPEQQRSSEVKTGAIEQAAAERAAELDRSREKSVENSNESEAAHSLEKARLEAQAEAISGKEQSAGEQAKDGINSTPVVTRTDREQSYKQTMHHVQAELSAPERAFSKIIHHPAVERVSETIGNTVARPNAILSGSVTALLLVTCLYFLARHIGFSLQGSETIVFFILGWGLGIGLDMLRSLFRS